MKDRVGSNRQPAVSLTAEKSMTQPGEKTTEQNRDYKHAMGEQPNNVANKWLAEHRGQQVVVYVGREAVNAGVLEAFDLYSFVVNGALFFKGPGVWIQQA